MKFIIDPSSAVSVASILKNRDKFADKKVEEVLTGDNVALNKLPWISNFTKWLSQGTQNDSQHPRQHRHARGRD
jgi:threonine dehydratase